MIIHFKLYLFGALIFLPRTVPWGSFQSYSIRPDADDGPFSSRLSDRPSEKAWRAFMEGDAVSNVDKIIARLPFASNLGAHLFLPITGVPK